jgi:hypothetical protein
MAAAAPAAAQAFPDEHWQLLRPYGEPGENTEFFNVAGAFLLGQEHWWCRHTRVAAEMLYLFQFDGIAIVDQLRAQSERHLGRCAHCVLAYHRAVAELRPRYQREFQQQSVDDFFGILRRRDVRRLAGCLTAGGVDAAACIYSVYEALAFPEVLQVRAAPAHLGARTRQPRSPPPGAPPPPPPRPQKQEKKRPGGSRTPHLRAQALRARYASASGVPAPGSRTRR